MLLPSTHPAALVLLIISFVCLGSWANTLKAAGGGWRFELYYFDFALGSIALAVLAAWTFGMLGSELSFVDRMAVAGLRPQALALAAGFIFSLGNILLLATVSLLGMSVAFPLVFAVALVVWTAASFAGSNPVLLGLALLLLVAAGVVATRVRHEPAGTPTKANRRPNVPAPVRKNTKGTATGIIGGIFLGAAYVLAENAFWGDLGLGAYAGLLLFAIGIVASTVLFNLFFLNMAIEGERLALPAYLKGNARQHLAGIAGGLLWSGGMLAALLARSVPAAESPAYATILLATQGSALLAVAWGVFAWSELHRTRKGLLIAVVVLYGGGLLALVSGSRHPTT